MVKEQHRRLCRGEKLEKILQNSSRERFCISSGRYCTENDFGEPIWLGRIIPNMINEEFQKQSIWEADKRIKIDGIRLDHGDIGMTIQWYEQVTGIPGSDLVYELECGQPPQVQSHTQLVHGKIAMTQVAGVKKKRRSGRHKIQLVAENKTNLEWKLNGGKDFYNKLAEEVII